MLVLLKKKKKRPSGKRWIHPGTQNTLFTKACRPLAAVAFDILSFGESSGSFTLKFTVFIVQLREIQRFITSLMSLV